MKNIVTNFDSENFCATNSLNYKYIASKNSYVGLHCVFDCLPENWNLTGLLERIFFRAIRDPIV